MVSVSKSELLLYLLLLVLKVDKTSESFKLTIIRSVLCTYYSVLCTYYFVLIPKARTTLLLRFVKRFSPFTKK